MHFSLRTFEIVVGEFDAMDNMVAEVVFDQKP
jgi:hypothetical protein